MKKLIVLFCFLIPVFAEKARFDNYRVYRVQIENSDQLKELRQLADTSDSYSFFDYPARVGSNVELIVSPHKFAHFIDITKSLKLQHEMMTSNLQSIFDKEESLRRAGKEGMEWTQYHDIDTIYTWLDSLQIEFPNWVNVTTIGTSYHGRPMKLLRISKKSGNRAIFVESNIHAREWIASATSTFIINELLRSTNPIILDISENVDWYFLPLANPDGFAYTWTENRNWRKTRSIQSVLCSGVDPNRNFGFNWMVPDEDGNTGSSTSPCSDTFSGPIALSEPECAATDKFLSNHTGIFDAYLALHSYQHSFLYPFGNTRDSAPNSGELYAIGVEAASRLFLRHGIQYSVGTWHADLYPSAGSSMDHAYGKFDIPISYTIEMRGNGNYGNFGFFLPPEFIIPNAEEILDSFVGLIEKAREFGRFQ